MGHKKITEPAIEEREREIAIKKLKNNKAPGIDNIQAELLIHTGREFSICVPT
jgi:hypothetical protein